MTRYLQSLWQMVKLTGQDWWEDKAPRLGAALAFYSVLSLGPLLLIVISVSGLVFGYEAASGQVVEQLRGLVGNEGAEAIQTVLVNSRRPEAGIFATIVGIITLLIGATGVFGQLQDALNTIWEVKAKPGRGVLWILRKRFLSFAMVLGTGFLLLISLAISAGLAALGQLAVDSLPEILMSGINFLISFGVTTLLFAMIFKILPDVHIKWRDVWMGAVITAALFTIGKSLIGIYLGHSALSSTYGASGSLIVLLLWIYYSAQILFLGAEFTQVYARRHGSGLAAARGAVPATREARAQEGMKQQKKHPRAKKRASPHAA